MNLATLEARTYARLGWDNANPGAAVVARVRGFINETYRELLGRRGFEQYRRQYLPVFIIAGQPICALTQAVTRIYSITDIINDRLLEMTTLNDIRRRDPGVDATGTAPTSYAVYNLSGAVRKPPDQVNGSILYFIGQLPADTSPKTVYVQGVDVFGYPRSASVALNGTTQVTIPSIAWVVISRFYLQIPSVQGLGAITRAAADIYMYVTSGVTASVISIIGEGASSARYSQVMLYPTPTTTATYQVDADIVVNDLVEEGDEPILPLDYHWLLSSGAVIKEYARREKPVEAAFEQRRFESGIGDLLMFANRQPSSRLWKERGRWSQLGNWFPPGT